MLKTKSHVSIFSLSTRKAKSNHYDILGRVLFTHELDSQNAFSAIDSGTFTDLPNGDSLEIGAMPRHNLTGAPMGEYEEVWRELTPREGPEGRDKGASWVLESENEDLGDQEGEIKVVKTFLGRVWGTYIALQQIQTHTRHRASSAGWKVSKTGTDVSARREEWESGFGWREKYVIGNDASIPSPSCGLHGEAEGPWRVPGEKVIIGDTTYIVRAFEEI